MKKTICLLLTAIMVFGLLPMMIAEDSSAEAKLTLTGGSYYYDGHAKTVHAEMNEAGWTIQYSYYSVYEKATWTEDAPTITNPGTLVVYARAVKNNDIKHADNAVILEVVGNAPVGSTVKIIANGSVTKASVYAGPRTNSDKLGELDAGDVCSLLSREGDWFEVSNGALTGFVYFEHISITSRPNGQGGGGPNMSLVQIKAKGGTFLYDGNPHYVEAYLVNGDGCTIEFSTDNGKTWTTDVPGLTEVGTLTVKVQACSDTEKKLYDQDVVLRVIATLPSGTNVKIIKHGSNDTAPVRQKAATNGTKLGSVDAGTVVQYLSREGDWIKIAHGDLVGYVYYWFVDLENLELKPTITSQPQDTWVLDNENTNFKVTASGMDPITYQWEKYDTGTNSWVAIAGETAATYSFKAVYATHNNMKVRCVVTDANGEVISGEATLTVINSSPTVDPTYPVDTGNMVGKPAVFSVVAIGAESYQWQYRKNSSDAWSDLLDNPTAQKAALMVTVTEENNGYEYRCMTENKFGTKPSNAAKLMIVKEKVQIKVKPYADKPSYNEGDTVTLTIGATGDALTYTWQRRLKGGKWEDCTGTGAKSDVFKPVAEWNCDGAQYRCVVRNPLKPKGVTSKVVKIKVVSAGPEIDTPTTDVTLHAAVGSKLEYSLTMKAHAGGKLKYVWEYYDVNKGKWVKYSTTEKLIIKKATTKFDGRMFRCKVYRNNSVDFDTSHIITVKVP